MGRKQTMWDVMWDFAKSGTLCLSVYMMGYFGYSPAWLLAILIVKVMVDKRKAERQFRIEFNKMLATSDEKELVLSCLKDLPAWVFFADMERAEWLNVVLKRLWPYVNLYAQDLLLESIEPAVQETLKAYSISGFKFTKTRLGNVPVRIGGVKCYSKLVGRDEIVMDMEIMYGGDCDIEVLVSGVRMGVADLQLRGTLRLVCKPLIKQIPLVGGVQAYFLNPPQLDFNLTNIGNAFEIPGLDSLIRTTVLEQICAYVVIPNKYVMSLSPDVPVVRLKLPEPMGVLRVQLLEAKELEKKDIGILGTGKSDPYAIITIGAIQYKTQMILNTVSPKWDYLCEGPVYSTHTLLGIRVMDHDDTGKDEDLGKVNFDIGSLASTLDGRQDIWVPLESAKTGRVHLRMDWLNLSDDRALLEAQRKEVASLIGMKGERASVALLLVYLDSARNLPELSGAASAFPNPEVRMTLGNQSFTSSPAYKTCNPVWESSHTFFIKSFETQDLNINVFDAKWNKSLGKIDYSIGLLLDQPEMELYQTTFHLKSSSPDAALVMTLRLRILTGGSTMPKEMLEEEDEGVVEITDEDKEAVPPPSSPVKKEEPPESKTQEPQTVAAPSAPVQQTAPARAAAGESKPAPSTPPSSKMAPSSPSSNKKAPATPPPSKKGVEKYALSTATKILAAQTAPLTTDAEGEGLRLRPTASKKAGDRGQIQATLSYSSDKQKLTVVVHRCRNLPMEPDDPDELPDPYVKCYLNPGREQKQKTDYKKDECNPVFDDRFTWAIPQKDMRGKSLEMVVMSRKSKMSKLFNKAPLMGRIEVDLGTVLDSNNHLSAWMDLEAGDSDSED